MLELLPVTIVHHDHRMLRRLAQVACPLDAATQSFGLLCSLCLVIIGGRLLLLQHRTEKQVRIDLLLRTLHASKHVHVKGMDLLAHAGIAGTVVGGNSGF